jgi:hypothetical protein
MDVMFLMHKLHDSFVLGLLIGICILLCFEILAEMFDVKFLKHHAVFSAVKLQ